MTPTTTAPATGSSVPALIRRYLPVVLSVYAAIIFVDSLRYKFTDHPKTQEIFGRLDAWAASLGAPGLFGHTGLFSQYVIGSAEIVASTLLLVGLTRRFRPLGVIGSLVGLAVMTGAISFHLFTPLGTDPNNDGGGLFIAACGVWLSMAILIALRWRDLLKLLGNLRKAVDQNA
jgi:uncharacterized membrane protein YphA (DoxX/SURF4 family)